MQDNEIVDLYWARAESAIAETSIKYGRYCKSIARNILASEQDADECVNDTYLGAWNAMPPQRPSRLAVFLGKITRNIALNKHDYNSAQKRNSRFDALLSELEECIPGPDSAEDAFDEGETARSISAFLRESTPEVRNVFLRRYWYAEPISAIAKRFQISESKVKSMLFRTRSRLKIHLEQEGIAL
ncbi:sigma-70 family RNA polymerase sigma factor [Ruminococcaceae bacterium OttesenSCG-928-L11]|nr:sigma-70 family RNA polymerase sigma factor [Ruminococcaceae bacterium OttesenSCG-928-L11]